MMKKYRVYVLRSLKDSKLYIGFTQDIEKRIFQHNSGKTASLKYRRPLVLVYSEEYVSKFEAQAREKFLKSGKGREELKAILARRTAPAEGGQEW